MSHTLSRARPALLPALIMAGTLALAAHAWAADPSGGDEAAPPPQQSYTKTGEPPSGTPVSPITPPGAAHGAAPGSALMNKANTGEPPSGTPVEGLAAPSQQPGTSH